MDMLCRAGFAEVSIAGSMSAIRVEWSEIGRERVLGKEFRMLQSRMAANRSLVLTLLLAALGTAGCAKQMAGLSGRRVISPADFAPHANGAPDRSIDVAPSVEPETSSAGHLAATGDSSDTEPKREFFEPPPNATPQTIVTDAPSATSSESAPSASTSTSSGPAQRIIVDSLIGQVNGRPIFADAFFEPIEDQILAARAQLSPQDFVNTMDRIIADRLNMVIMNELVLAEAEAALTADVRVGLRYWLKDMEEQKLAESLGVRARAEQSLAEEGMTLDEYLRLKKDEALVYKLVSEKIEPRVIVTWRDMEREFERRQSEFNPPAMVKLGKIVLRKESEADMIAAVDAGIADGKSLAEIGSTLSKPNAYTEDEYQLGPDGMAGLPLNADILDAIKGLNEGATSRPVEVTIAPLMAGESARVSVYWYQVVSVTRSESRTLYDPVVQRQLYNEVYRRRLDEERDRYLMSLMSKGIYDDVEEMSLRLRRVALLRYGRR